MREIKFRAWDKKHNQMVLWEDIKRTNTLGAFVNNNNRDISDGILMQYTGLKDIDGIEIYEGDIVQIVEYEARYDGKFDEFRSEVIFTDGCFSYMQYEEHLGCKTDYCLSSVCTEDGVDSKGSHFCNVIGNIYEHKHLLRGE